MSKRRERGRIGAACEFLVAADLLSRGLEVTRPVNPQAKHDLHVDLPSVGWKGVQVKAARKDRKRLRLDRGIRNIESPILALVYLPTRTIEYRAVTKPLPIELR